MSDQPRPTPSEPLRFFQYRYNEKRDAYYFETPIGRSRWYAKQGACKTDAFLAEQECKRRGWILNRESDAREERIRELEAVLADTSKVGAMTIGKLQAKNATLREALVDYMESLEDGPENLSFQESERLDKQARKALAGEDDGSNKP